MTKNLIVMLLCLLPGTKAFSQDTVEKDTIWAKKYLDKGYGFSMAYKKDSALHFYNKAANIYNDAQHWERYFECLNRISRLHLMFGDYETTLKTSNQVIKDSENKIGADNVAQANAYVNQVLVNYEKRQFKSALDLNKKALAIQKKNTKEEDEDVAAIYNIMGLIYKDMASYELAQEYLEKSLNLTISLLGEQTNNAAHGYNNLGLVFALKQEYSKSLLNHKKALSLRKQLFGERHVQVGSSYNNIAIVYSELTQLDSALFMYKKAYELFSDVLGENHTYTITTINNVGFAYSKLSKFDSALKYHRKALELEMLKPDANAASLTHGYKAVGDCYVGLKECHKAVDFYQKSLVNNSLSFSSDDLSKNPTIDDAQHPIFLADAIKNKANALQWLYSSEKDLEYLNLSYQAYMAWDKAASAIKKSNVNNADKLEFAADHAPVYEKAIKVCIELAKQTKSDEYLHKAFYLAERNKGGMLSESLGRLSVKNAGFIPSDLSELEKNIKTDKSNYQSLIVNTQDSVLVEEYKKNLFATNRRYDSLVLVLKENFPSYHQMKYAGDSTKVDDIRQVIDDKTLLVEYFKGDSMLYVFTVSSEFFNVDTISGTVTNDVDDLRNVIGLWKRNDQSDSTFSTYTKAAHRIYNLVLKKYLNDKNINKLIIIPDGRLAYIPFEILLKNDKDVAVGDYSSLDYLIKDYSVSYVYSSTLYFSKRSKELHNTNYLGFAPSYASNTYQKSELRDVLVNLDWNQKEVKDISDKIGGDVWLGTDATETAFKGAVNHSGIVHLSMHSFIDDSDPMHSKLVFATDDLDSLNDGLLHTYEIFNMELQAEMVVLSACNTGTGKLKKGEGMMSLAYAFAYAGCPSILMSQWSVDDKSTSQLMVSFYKNIADGMTKSEALRNAKISFVNNSGSRYANPSYWGSFVLFGNVEPLGVRQSDNTIIYLSLMVGLILIVVLFRRFKKKESL